MFLILGTSLIAKSDRICGHDILYEYTSLNLLFLYSFRYVLAVLRVQYYLSIAQQNSFVGGHFEFFFFIYFFWSRVRSGCLPRLEIDDGAPAVSPPGPNSTLKHLHSYLAVAVLAPYSALCMFRLPGAPIVHVVSPFFFFFFFFSTKWWFDVAILSPRRIWRTGELWAFYHHFLLCLAGFRWWTKERYRAFH